MIGSNSATASPADRMQLALQAAVQAGSVKTADESALSTALTKIDSSIQSGSTAILAPDPTSIKDKVSSLIDDQVANGTITSDQATELRQVFAQASQKMGGHHHHMHASGGSSADQSNPIDALFSDLTNMIDGVLGTSSTSNATAAASATSTNATSGVTAASTTSASSSTGAIAVDTLAASIDQLVSFLKQAEQSAVAGYTSAGATTASTLTSNPMLVDTKV